jgi:lipoprotein-anchoring transpeptidase ErfK/SrfK
MYACAATPALHDSPSGTQMAAPAPTPAPPAPYLVIRLKERRVHLMHDGATDPVASFPIAIGRKGHETPIGRFAVEEKIVHPEFPRLDPTDRTRVLETVPPGPENPLGERWIGFAHGPGWSWTVGMHGTPHPELLGKAVSGGCIRMRNADVIRLYDIVELGTPVIVEP